MNSIKKSNDKTQNVSIKQEKPDLYPLEHYIDDRVDLVQQVFSSLKSKTIQNLTPDFLKNVPITELEELCLNELLGISTKRLTSIINATKCPTDTESDSDVDDIVEHISLEEISSDSADEKKVKPKKLTDKRKRKNETETQGKDKNEISVLELLELQARARAIRSQLALEPIAKIEVDSDESETVEQKQPAPKKKSPIESKPGKSLKSSPSNGHLTKSNTNPKRIKLKRNFRKPTESNDESEKNDGNGAQEEKLPSSSKIAKSDDKIRDKSPSPDVITILPSPETLCISDSSEDDTDPANEETPKSNGVGKTAEDSKSAPLSQSEDHSPRGHENRCSSDIEEGEILEKEEQSEPIVENEQNTQNNLEINESTNSVVDNQTRTEKIPDDNKTEKDSNQGDEELTSCYEGNACDSNEDLHNDDVISLEHEELDEYNIDDGEKPMDLSRTEQKDGSFGSVSSKLPERNVFESSRKSIECHESIECIEIDDDDNDDITGSETTSKNESSSWNHRWLKSAKVSRILAASRLGNRVRDRIKQSKRAESSPVPSEAETASPKEDTISKFEDGSVQQYREILEKQKLNQ